MSRSKNASILLKKFFCMNLRGILFEGLKSAQNFAFFKNQIDFCSRILFWSTFLETLDQNAEAREQNFEKYFF